MRQFGNVIDEMKKWLTGFEWVNFCLPFDIYMLFGSVGLLLLNDLLILFHISIPLNILGAVGYYGFLLGALVTLISKNIKYLPYGFWAYAFLVAFPFDYINLSTVLGVLFWGYLGYALMQYTAVADIG